MGIQESTRAYEHWLRGCVPVVEAYLRDKHIQMRRNFFRFFRGTYYRWVELWPVVCAEERKAPKVLAVGDLHVSNFATWRDAEGRLAWGIDDFDEAYPLPYTNDLVCLATSLKIMIDADVMTTKLRTGCDALLTGYIDALRHGGIPIVLAERDQHLEKLGIEEIKPPADFWMKLRGLRSIRRATPPAVFSALVSALPQPDLEVSIVRREAGVGSLGQPRFVAIAQCDGGYVAREAKELIPSASAAQRARRGPHQPYYERAVHSAIRAPDPFLNVVGSWLIRRLSPDSTPIEVESLSGRRDEEVLLRAMGRETANVHLGTGRNQGAIIGDLRSRKAQWLPNAAKHMTKTLRREWEDYRTVVENVST